MVEGRNNKSLDELVTAPEAQAANLVPEEVLALRLCSGPLRHIYDDILGQLSSELLTSRNTYPTTIALVVSGIKKLSAVAKAPEGGAVWRSLASGLGMPDAFFERDEQGFAWGMVTGFMATSRDEIVALKCSSGEGEGEGEGRTVFKILLGKMSLGANIAWLSQFEGESEMLFPPRTQLQIVPVAGDDGVATLKPVVGKDGVAVVTLKPTLFQDISTVEEVTSARKEGLRQLTSSLMWDLRTEADRDKEFTPALVQRIDQLEHHLLDKYCKEESGWYNENLKYKQAFQGLVHEATEAKKTIRDDSSPLARRAKEEHMEGMTYKAATKNDHIEYGNTLVPNTVAQVLHDHTSTEAGVLSLRKGETATLVEMKEQGWCVLRTAAGMKGYFPQSYLAPAPAAPVVAMQAKPPASGTSAPVKQSVASSAGSSAQVESSSEVSVLHSKYTQDPKFKGVRGKFGNDRMFVDGLEGIVGPMDIQYVRSMYNEHCLSSDADSALTAWNAGHTIKTTPRDEWAFVVGEQGLNLRCWTLIPAESVPRVLRALESGRNAKRLADLLNTLEARAANLSAAEVVALRLYTGPMYVKYNAVLRGLGTGGNRYAATIYLVCSGLRKLSRMTKLPKGLMVYRGNGGMALPFDFLEPDAQGCAGGVERALMSTTPKREVALGYAGLAAGKELPTLFEIELDKFSIGASIAWLSQFEGEEEILYAPLTYLEIIAPPQLVLHEGKELSVVRLQMTVNQKTATVEQVERSRCVFLEQLANNLAWEARHWVNKNQLAHFLPTIEDMRAGLQAVVAATDARTLHDNTAFAEAFGRVLEKSEHDRVHLAETVWQVGMQARERREVEEAAMLFEAAINGRGKGLCDDTKAGRDRVVDMRRQLLALHVGGGGAGGVWDLLGGFLGRCACCPLLAPPLFDDKDYKVKVANGKFALASDLDNSGDYAEALALYEEALVLCTEAFGHNSPDVATTYNNIAIVYRQQGKYDEALVEFQKSLDIRIRVVGHEHPGVAATLVNMAVVYDIQGKYDEALDLYHKAEKVLVGVHGHEHPDVADTKYNIADTKYNIAALYKDQGKLEEARQLYLECEQIYTKVYGTQHTETLDAARKAASCVMST